MKSRRIRFVMKLRFNCVMMLMISLASMVKAQSGGVSSTAPRVFAGAKVDEIYRVVLDRGALLLESINEVIRQNRILEGQVLVSAGSVEECTFHFVKSTEVKPKDIFKTVKGPFEILNAGGIIAEGQPHIHITLASSGKAAIGGHLEKGCRILYLGELTIVKYAAPPLTRKPNANGVMMLEAK